MEALKRNEPAAKRYNRTKVLYVPHRTTKDTISKMRQMRKDIEKSGKGKSSFRFSVLPFMSSAGGCIEMNRLDWVTHCTEALEVEDEMNREWDRKKSKYCCWRCEKSSRHDDSDFSMEDN